MSVADVQSVPGDNILSLSGVSSPPFALQSDRVEVGAGRVKFE